MSAAVLTISSKNYSSWCLRAWLLCKMSGIPFKEKKIALDDAAARAELLLLSPSCLVPCLDHDGAHVWDTLSIGNYLNELQPDSPLYPTDRLIRAHCRSVCGEMHSGFYNLRSALPMNLKAHFPNFKVWSGALPDIARIIEIWEECLSKYGGPYLFGDKPNTADAMYAPVCTRFKTYDVKLPPKSQAYCDTILNWPILQEWIKAAKDEPEEIEELDVEF